MCSIRIKDKSAYIQSKTAPPPKKKLSLAKSLKNKALNKKNTTDGKGRGRGGETSVLVFYFNQGISHVFIPLVKEKHA